MLNLDTHILLHALEGLETREEHDVLSRNIWSISAIVLWEIGKLSQLGRIRISLNDDSLIEKLAEIHIWPIDLAVCRVAATLDFRSDPADELIAATSIVHKIPLLTRDARILASKLVPFA